MEQKGSEKDNRINRPGIRRIMIAGTKSGCGKTTIVCGLLRIFSQRGERPAAFKCGPDYIDPLYHREVLGVASRNLDSFFMTKEMLLRNLRDGSRDAGISLIEGAMGYYDGLGTEASYSCSEIAEMTETPVILIVDCSGRALSAAAELHGFLKYRPEGAWIRGVIFNRIPPSLYPELAACAEAEGVTACGYLHGNAVKKWESRHLGLITPTELPKFQEEADRLAEKVAETVDVEAVLRLAGEAGTPAGGCDADTKAHGNGADTGAHMQDGETAGQEYRPDDERPVIALASDEAFCFYYIENIEYLERNGCRIVRFSPLRDKVLPECDGLILPGGYPELYAEALSGNSEMREQIRERIRSGVPTIAECGGFLYLHRMLNDAEGCDYAMAGVISADCTYVGFQKTFGYVNVSAKREGLFGKEGLICRGHEFHYFVSDLPDEDLICEKPNGSRSWTGGLLTETLYAAFPHLYLPGSEAGDAFVRKVFERAKENRKHMD